MGISEFAVHNVLRTYSRQERLGRAQRPREGAASPARSSDQVTLSAAARKVQWISQFAAEVVDARYPTLPPEERQAQVRSVGDEILARHRDELSDDGLHPEAFEGRLRRLYIG